MSAEVPPAGTGPLPVVPAGTTGPLVPFTEHAGLDPATGRLVMYVRVAQNGEPGPAPGLRLTAGAGPATDVGAAPTPVTDGADGAPVALAVRTDEPDRGLTLVEIEVLQTGRPWALQIVNSDTADHTYVWVVADTVDASRLPWLDLPVTELAFHTTVGEAAPRQDLTVANHGTGPLILTDPDGAALGAGCTLLSVTPRTIATNSRGTARIGFTTPAAPTSLAATRAFASNDPGAGAAAGHGNRVALTVTAARPDPRWVAGDLLLLRGPTLGVVRLSTDQLVPVTTDTVGAVDVAVDPTTGDALLLGAGFVLRVDRFTGAKTPLPGFSALHAPAGLDVVGEGTVVVVDRETATQIRVPRGDGARDVVTYSVGALDGATDVALEAAGDVVACGELSVLGPASESVVVRLGFDGSLAVLAAGAPLALTDGARALAVEESGTILVACRSQVPGVAGPGGSPIPTGTLIRVGPGSTQDRVAAGLQLREPVGLAVADDGTILVSTRRGLVAVHPQTGDLTRLSEKPGGRIAVVPPLGTP